MDNKKKSSLMVAGISVISIPFLIFFIIFIFPWLVLLIGTILLPSVPRPMIRSADFPIRVDYRLGEDDFRIENTISIRFDGIMRLIGESERRWEVNFVDAQHLGSNFIIFEADGMIASYRTGSPEYLMGMREARYLWDWHIPPGPFQIRYNDPHLVLHPNPDRFSFRFEDGVRMYTHYFTSIERLFEAISLNYDITLMNWQPPEPIVNSVFRPFWMVVSAGIFIAIVIMKRKAIMNLLRRRM